MNKVPLSACPHCGILLDGAASATGEEGRAPTAGCVTICIECLGVSQYDENLSLKPVHVPDLPFGLVQEIERAQGVFKTMKEEALRKRFGI